MGIISTGMVMKVAIELSLGIGIKLFCDNGRVHPADFANDFLYWIPGMSWQDDDGLSRQMQATHHPVLETETAMHGVPQLAK